MKLRRQQFGARLSAAGFGVRRLVAAFPGWATCRQPAPRSAGRGLFEHAYVPDASLTNARRRQVACRKRGQVRALQSAFTLIELVVVMTLLVTVIALASPSLAGFFRGRALDAEARRLMSLTRLGQSRAASEGLPMILWVDATTRTYGLEADSSFVDQDSKAVEYALDGNLTVEIGAMDSAQSAITSSTLFENTTSTSKRASQPHIRFEPDGGVSASSPESFRLMERDGGSLWVGLSANRLNYEIHSQETQRVAKRLRQ